MKRMIIALLFALTATQVSARVYDEVQNLMDKTTSAAQYINNNSGMPVAGPAALVVGLLVAKAGMKNIFDVAVGDKPMTRVQTAWKLVKGALEIGASLLLIPVGVTFTHNIAR